MDGPTLRDEWEAEAERWIAWTRTPGLDSYWRHHRRQFLGLLPAPGRLTLDVGCGEGRLSRDLASLGHRVVGLEPSPTLAAAAVSHGHGETTARADAAALPVPDGGADLVVAFMVLHDVDDLTGALSEIARVLEPGSRAVIAIVHPLNSAGAFGDDGSGSFHLSDGYLARRRTDDTAEYSGLSMRFVSEHRPLVDYSLAIEAAGLLIEAVREPTTVDPSSRWAELPLFLQLRLVKPPVAPLVGRHFFHITTPADADRLIADGALEPLSLATEGFAHCSTAEQVVATTQRWMADLDDLVLVELDAERLDADVRWPEVYPGQRFPHVHGPINGEAVVNVHPWRPSDREAWMD